MTISDAYPDVVKTFLEIITIGNPSKKEDELILWLVDKFAELGVTSIVQDDLGNVVARIASNIENNNLSIMFVAHLDSVSPCENIEPEIVKLENDSIIQPKGDTILSADDKAGIAAIIEAIKLVKKDDFKYPDIELVFTVQEEIGLRGAKSLDYSQFESKIAYSVDAEAPVGTIITQGPSQKQFKLTFKGKASHAGMAPEKGLNSIVMTAEFLNNITAGRIDEATTSNIGLIEGGVANNVVPEKTILKGEVRSLYESKLEGIIGSYRMAADKVVEQYPGASYEFEEIFIYHSFFIDTSSPVVQLALKACKDINLQSQVRSIGSGSDANVFNNNQLDTIILGAGFKNSHSHQEMITFSQLQLLCDLIVSIIKNASKINAKNT
jgi:tripeptide aminopeptidase